MFGCHTAIGHLDLRNVAAVAMYARKNMNLFGGCPAAAEGMRYVLHLTSAHKAGRAWLTTRLRDIAAPSEGASIRLLYRVFQPVFFARMRRNDLISGWASAGLGLDEIRSAESSRRGAGGTRVVRRKQGRSGVGVERVLHQAD